MSDAAKKIAEEFIGAAQRSPENAPEILRQAAQTFSDLAAQEKDPRAKTFLTNIGFEFVGVAAKAQEKQATSSDFVQLMHDTATAWNELGPRAAMSQSAALDATAIQRVNHIESVPDVSIQPRTFLNKNATLGRAATVTFNPTQEQTSRGIVQQQTVAFWQGEKRESQAMSVDFGTLFPPRIFDAGQGIGLVSRPYAIVQYGADGNTQNSVTMDVGQGRRITVVGNYISVQVGMGEPFGVTDQVAIPSPPYAPTPELSIGASIGTFAAPSTAPVTRTVYFDLDLGIQSVAAPIPLRAVAMLPPTATTSGTAAPLATGDEIVVDFLGFDGTLLYEYSIIWSPAAQFVAPFIFPEDAYFIQVFYTSLASGAHSTIRVPFQLSL